MSEPLKWSDSWGIAPDFKSNADLLIDGLMEHHWLVFNDDRQVTGCHCGFQADLDADCGWGDSVVAHLFRVAVDC